MRGLKFIALSGVGWLFDITLFAAAVWLLRSPEGVTNFVTATVAAMTVYACSRAFVFNAPPWSFREFGVYLLYTEANIVCWSLVIHWLTEQLLVQRIFSDPSIAAIVSKVGVTPFSMLLNFAVARRLSKGR